MAACPNLPVGPLRLAPFEPVIRTDGDLVHGCDLAGEVADLFLWATGRRVDDDMSRPNLEGADRE
jgi:hypothetical protein